MRILNSIIAIFTVTALCEFFNWIKIENYALWVITLLFLLTVKLIIVSRRAVGKDKLLTIGYIFFASVVLVHFQLLLWLESLETFPSGDLENFLFVNQRTLRKSTLLTVISLIYFVKGYCYKRKILSRTESHKDYSYQSMSNSFTKLTIVSFIILLFVNPHLIQGTYNLLGLSSLTKYTNALFQVVITGALSYTILAQKKTKFDSIRRYVESFGLGLNIVFFSYLLLSIRMGDRGIVLGYSLLYISGYVKNLRLKVYWIIPGLIIGALFMNSMRSTRGRNVSGLSTVEQSYYSPYVDRLGIPRGIMALPLELGLSVRCLNHAVSYQEEGGSFHYGYFQMKQLIGAIPFCSNVFSQLLNRTAKRYDGSSGFITFLIQGNNPKYGDGTTPIADIYLDFGLVGLIVCLWLFGNMTSSFDQFIYGRRYIGHLPSFLALVYLSSSFYLGRAPLLIVWQRVLPAYIIGRFLILLLRNKNA